MAKKTSKSTKADTESVVKSKKNEESLEDKIVSWSKIHTVKTSEKDINKERGDVYELLSLEALTPYMNINQKKGYSNYKVVDYSRSIKLTIGGQQIFETDSFISLQRSNKLLRYLQKIFNISDEYGLAIQCKNYSGKVDKSKVQHDTSQTALADIIGSNLRVSTRKLFPTEEVLDTIGDNYLLYNTPVFEKIKTSKTETLRTLERLINAGQNLEEKIGSTSVSIKPVEVVDCNFDIDGTTYDIVKVKSEKDNENSDTIYYVHTPSNSFKVIEKTYNVSLGQLVFAQHKLKLFRTYRMLNIPPENVKEAERYIKLFLNIEQFDYLSPMGLRGDADSILKEYNGVAVSMDELLNGKYIPQTKIIDGKKVPVTELVNGKESPVYKHIGGFKEGKFFEDYHKFDYDINFGYTAVPADNLEGELLLRLGYLTDKGVPKRNIKRSIKNFVKRKPIFA